MILNVFQRYVTQKFVSNFRETKKARDEKGLISKFDPQ